MLKEARQEPEAARDTILALEDRSREVAGLIDRAAVILCAGSGSSFHAALYLQNAMIGAGKPCITFQSSEYPGHRQLFSGSAVLVVFSQSGESVDAVNALKASRSTGMQRILVTSCGDSEGSSLADLSLVTPTGREESVAATKSYIGEIAASLSLYIAHGKLPASEYAQKAYHAVRRAMEAENGIRKNSHSIKEKAVILGTGSQYPTALEAALKLRETSGIIAEGFSPREYLHGYIRTLDRETSVVTVGQYREDDSLDTIGKIMRYTGTRVVIDSGPFEDQGDRNLLEPFETAARSHLLAYYLAVNRDLDPDNPDRLAKVVRPG